MTKVININERGTLTLPKELRESLGIRSEGQIVAEETDEGILLRPSATFPVEMYSKERLTEFKKNNDEVLKDFSFADNKK